MRCFSHHWTLRNPLALKWTALGPLHVVWALLAHFRLGVDAVHISPISQEMLGNLYTLYIFTNSRWNVSGVWVEVFGLSLWGLDCFKSSGILFYRPWGGLWRKPSSSFCASYGHLTLAPLVVLYGGITRVSMVDPQPLLRIYSQFATQIYKLEETR